MMYVIVTWVSGWWLIYFTEEKKNKQTSTSAKCASVNTGVGNRKGRAELCSVFPVRQEVSRVRPQKHDELLL